MASAKKTAAALQKQKEAKQKKLLFALLPVFLLLAVWQGPKMYSSLLSKPVEEEPVAAATTAPNDPTTAPPPTASPAGEEAPAAGGLQDTDLAPGGDVSKLIAFSRFTARDPFRAPPGTESGSGTGSGSGSGSDSSSGSGSGSGGEELGTAVFEVNGSDETVSVGEEFPAVDPTFTLVSVSEDGAVIGVVQGMFEDGSATMEIAVGERVVLVAAPETTRFTVELLEVS